MSINRTRRLLYRTAKILGDVQAATHKKPCTAIPKRVGRRLTGNLFARIMRGLFPPTKGK